MTETMERAQSSFQLNPMDDLNDLRMSEKALPLLNKVKTEEVPPLVKREPKLTRPLVAVVPDDPGAWSGILDVLQRRGALPGRRRAEPANGLMISPPPRTALPLVGTQEGVAIAGVDFPAYLQDGAFRIRRGDATGVELAGGSQVLGSSCMPARMSANTA